MLSFSPRPENPLWQAKEAVEKILDLRRPVASTAMAGELGRPVDPCPRSDVLRSVSPGIGEYNVPRLELVQDSEDSLRFGRLVNYWFW